MVPAHNVLTVAGDFNAHVGPDDSAFTYNHATNRNGEMLVEYAEESHLMFANNNFMKPAAKLWTFQHPFGSRSQIDYILIRKKWRNSIRNCQAYSSFSSIGSDHRIVSCTTCLSLRSSKRPDTNPMKTIDWELVFSISTIRQQFAIDVRNRYDSLSKLDNDIETIYNNITICMEEVTLSTLPKRKKQKPPPMSAHSLVKEAQKAVITARKQHHDKLSKASLRKINQAQRQLDEAYANAEAEYIQGKIDRLPPKNVVHQHVSAWDTIKDLTGHKSKPLIRVKGGLSSERKKNWLDHFKNLPGTTPTTSDNQEPARIQIADTLNISTDPSPCKSSKQTQSSMTYCCASVTTHFSIETLHQHDRRLVLLPFLKKET